jgi:hypothetical protein
MTMRRGELAAHERWATANWENSHADALGGHNPISAAYFFYQTDS